MFHITAVYGGRRRWQPDAGGLNAVVGRLLLGVDQRLWWKRKSRRALWTRTIGSPGLKPKVHGGTCVCRLKRYAENENRSSQTIRDMYNDPRERVLA